MGRWSIILSFRAVAITNHNYLGMNHRAIRSFEAGEEKE
jgi:hypothetical protein